MNAPSTTSEVASVSQLELPAEPGTEASDVMTVDEAAHFLRIGRNQLYAAISRNEVPHQRLGRSIRLSRAGIMRWLTSWSSQDAKERQ
jgi:excisionase family DNA binding protein